MPTDGLAFAVSYLAQKCSLDPDAMVSADGAWKVSVPALWGWRSAQVWPPSLHCVPLLTLGCGGRVDEKG